MCGGRYERAEHPPVRMEEIPGAKYRHALEARDWLYITEVMDLSEYAGCDLT